MNMEQFFSKAGEYLHTFTEVIEGTITQYHQHFVYTKGKSVFDGKNWKYTINTNTNYNDALFALAA